MIELAELKWALSDHNDVTKVDIKIEECGACGGHKFCAEILVPCWNDAYYSTEKYFCANCLYILFSRVKAVVKNNSENDIA